MRLQANARCCFVCGMENNSGLRMRFYESEEDPPVVTADYTVPGHFEGYPGIVHGGIVAAMLDEITARTVMRGDPPRLAVTAKLSIRYRRPVPVETPLKLMGRVVKDSGRVAQVAGEIVGPDGTLLAEAEAAVTEVDPEYFANFAPMHAQDWRVYLENVETQEGGQE